MNQPLDPQNPRFEQHHKKGSFQCLQQTALKYELGGYQHTKDIKQDLQAATYAKLDCLAASGTPSDNADFVKV